jgi:hypothetical protein
MRILFAGAVVFLAVWFTLLRPKSPDVPVTPAATPAAGNVNTGAPAVSGAGKVVEKAKTAAANAENSAKAAAGEATTTPTAQTAPATTPGSATTSAPDTKPVTAFDAIPAAVLAKLPHDVAGALTARKVLVLAVLTNDGKPWRPLADDDRYVRNTLKKVNRYDGNVLVKQVALSQLAGYSALVNDLHVNQTPSIVVVDRNLKANVLAGYVDRIAINQAIADARRTSIDVKLKDPYLRKVNDICGNFSVRASRWSLPTIPGKKAYVGSLGRIIRIYDRYGKGIARTAAPARWRGLRKQFVAHLARQEKTLRSARQLAAHNHLTAASLNAAAGGELAAATLNKRFDTLALTSCSATRRS